MRRDRSGGPPRGERCRERSRVAWFSPECVMYAGRPLTKIRTLVIENTAEFPERKSKA